MLLAATPCKTQTLERLWCKSWVLRKLPILLRPNCPCFRNQILKMPPIPQGTFQEAQTVKNLPAMQETHWVRDLGSGRFSWRREWLPTPVFLPGKVHGQKSLVVYSPGVTKSQTLLSTAHADTYHRSLALKDLHVLWKPEAGEVTQVGGAAPTLGTCL